MRNIHKHVLQVILIILLSIQLVGAQSTDGFFSVAIIGNIMSDSFGVNYFFHTSNLTPNCQIKS